MTSRATPRGMQRSASVFVLLAGLSGTAPAGDFDCIIEPRQTIELRSPVEGLIERITADRGDFISKGQVLALLDTSVDRALAAIARQRMQMEGAVRSGESRVEFTTKKSQRMQELQNENYMSTLSSDEALTEKRLAEADLRDAMDNR